tara:strand:+ start:1015 stop:1815 length:801 start_codon:yes stop_codon:yes gene_type:complete
VNKRPIFILGVGAQKAGTSWLHKQLSRLSNANFGVLKEYHIWDALYVGHCNRWIIDHLTNQPPLEILRYLMQTGRDAYETYFYGLISDKITVTGDITPSYAALNKVQFQAVKSRLESIGFSVKVIFLMRDPVSRNWSALRFYNRQRINRGNISASQLVKQFEEFYSSQEVIDRVSYDKTVSAINSVFRKDDIFISFYETLFTERTMSQLSDFLGVDIREFDLREKINATKSLDLPKGDYNQCRKFFSNVYTFCEHEFPETKILWKA